MINGAVDILLELTKSKHVKPELRKACLERHLYRLVAVLVKCFDTLQSTLSFFLNDQISSLIKILIQKNNEIRISNPQNQQLLNSDSPISIFSNSTYLPTGLSINQKITAFENCENFLNTSGILIVKSLYTEKVLSDSRYITDWKDQLIQLIIRHTKQTEFFNISIENIFHRELFNVHLHISKMWGFLQKNLNKEEQRELYRNNFHILDKYFSNIIDKCFEQMNKFELKLKKVDKNNKTVMEYFGDFIKDKPSGPGLVFEDYFTPFIMDVPENVITDIYYDSYNIKIKIIVDLLLETFKFYYRVIKFLEMDKVAKEYLVSSASKNNNKLNSIQIEMEQPETFTWNINCPQFIQFMDSVHQKLLNYHRSMEICTDFSSPRLFNGVLKRLHKNQKYLRKTRLFNKAYDINIRIVKKVMSINCEKVHSLVWEKMVIIFKTVGKE